MIGHLLLGALQYSRPEERVEGLVRMNASLLAIPLGLAPELLRDLTWVIGRLVGQEILAAALGGQSIIPDLREQLLALQQTLVEKGGRLSEKLLDGVMASITEYWKSRLAISGEVARTLVDGSLSLGELLITIDGASSVAPGELKLWQMHQQMLSLEGLIGAERRPYALPGRPDLQPFAGWIDGQVRRSLRPYSSPLVLDLDGDGIETLALESAGVLFDLDDDGRMNTCGWVAPDDALLVWDRNGDGRIGSGAELFGNHTRLADGSRAAHGFEALAALDADHNGRLDDGDPAWERLALWRDRNSDGQQDPGELFRLSEAGIDALPHQFRAGSGLDAQGNDLREVGQYRHRDGHWQMMADVWFASLSPPLADAVEPGPSDLEAAAPGPLPELRPLLDLPEPESEVIPGRLPNIKGIGAVDSLRRTMRQDSSGRLRQCLEQWLLADAQGRAELIPDIIYHWTGVADYAGTAPVPLPDPRMMEALHAFTNHEYRANPQPIASSTQNLLDLFQGLCRMVGGLLEARDQLVPQWSRLSRMTPDGTGISFEESQLTAVLQAQLERSISDAQLIAVGQILSGFALVGEGLQEGILREALRDPHQLDRRLLLMALRHSMSGSTLTSERISGAERELLEGTASFDVIVGYGGDDYILSHGSNDSIIGGTGNDLIVAGSGDDIIREWEGDDTLIGGAGNDILECNLGTNQLLFRRGDGRDVIVIHQSFTPYDPRSHTNTLIFAAGITPDDLAVTHYFNNMILRLKGSDDQVILQDYFFGYFPHPSRQPIQALRFSNGEQWGHQQLIARGLIATEGDDHLDGSEADETISAGAGHDFLGGGPGRDLLQGDSGNDELHDGTGDDTLSGGTGHDRIHAFDGSNSLLFSPGDGNDLIMGSTSTATNTLHLAAGFSRDTVTIRRQDSELLLRFNSSGDSVQLKNFFWYDRCTLDTVPLARVQFSDGSSWEWSDLLARSMQGDEANNTLIGLIGNDTLRGEGGNDSLLGRDGHDLLQGGSGNDTLNGQNGNDRLEGGSGDDELQSFQAGGDDTLVGGGGNNLFHYQAGNLRLAANETGAPTSSNTLSLPYLQLAELSLIRQDRMLRIGTPSGAAIWVEDFFRDGLVIQPWNPLQLLRTAGGTSLDARNLASRVSNSFLGTSSANKLIGRDSDDWFDGLGGNDLLQGLGGHDQLRGDSGNDTLEGGAGNDGLWGGDGSDTASWAGQSTAVVVDLCLGTPQDTGAGIDSLSSIEHLLGGSGPDRLWGQEGANRLEGGDHDDWLEGGGGNDTLIGGNHLAGGDTASYERSPGAVQVNLALTAIQNTGAAGSDLLSGIEHLAGSAHHDSLSGSAAANRLEGGGGQDTLRGGAGADSLRGGDGADRFVYGTAAEAGLGAGLRDWISDLSEADRIDLTAIDAHADLSGNQAFSWIGNAPFSALAQLRLIPLANGNSLLEGNCSGTTAAEFQIELAAGSEAIVSATLLL
ncbi:MAG: calcium-binding protein [Cyanobium sp.]